MSSAETYPKDDGFSLVELIVSIMVSSIILVAVGSLLFNSWRTQEEVTSMTQATNSGQLMGAMIERAIRNAEEIDTGSASTDVLIVRTCLGSGDDPPNESLKYQGFAVTADPSSGTEHASRDIIRFATSNTPLLADPTSWPEWQPHVHVTGWDITSPATGVVNYTFEVETDSAPVQITGTVKMRSQSQSLEDGCWS